MNLRLLETVTQFTENYLYEEKNRDNSDCDCKANSLASVIQNPGGNQTKKYKRSNHEPKFSKSLDNEKEVNTFGKSRREHLRLLSFRENILAGKIVGKKPPVQLQFERLEKKQLVPNPASPVFTFQVFLFLSFITVAGL